MNTYTLTPEERFNLILECRNSGLTDYQWCKQKGISTNTLYRWINRFRQNGYPDIPKAKGKSQIAPAKQESSNWISQQISRAKVSRTTMANWAIQCNSLYFKHLADYFHRQLLKRKYLMMDETPIQVLHEPDRTSESKSYVWLMRSGNDGLPPIIYYRYAPTQSGDVALRLTDGIQPGTYLMCDGFSGYNKLKDVRR